MPNKHSVSAPRAYSKANRFAEIMRQYLVRMQLTHNAAGRVLRISPRSLRYLLSGKSIPNGSTLALIESDLARGAGCSVGDVRSAVAMDRADREPSVAGAGSYSNSPKRIARTREPEHVTTGRGRP